MLAQLFSCRKPTNTTISEFRLVDSSAAAEREREGERECHERVRFGSAARGRCTESFLYVNNANQNHLASAVTSMFVVVMVDDNGVDCIYI